MAVLRRAGNASVALQEASRGGGGQQTKPALLEILQQEWVQCNGLHGPINQDMMLQHQMRQCCWVVLGCVAFSRQLTQSAWLLQVHVVPQ